MIADGTKAKALKPDIIEGYVLDRTTRQPVMWANVHITYSDEMAITIDTGEFKVLSFRNLPVTVKVEHDNFEPVVLKITCANQRLVIMLKRIYR